MVDSVIPNKDMHGNKEMNTIGYLMAAIMLVLILPLLPFIVVLYLVYLLTSRTSRDQREVETSIQ